MNVSELIKSGNEKYAHPVTVEGYLIVSCFMTYIVDDERKAYSGDPHFGLLLKREMISQLDDIDIPLLAGSSVEFTGKVKIKGTITNTGLSLMPIYMPYVYEFSFQRIDDEKEYFFKNSDVFQDVYLSKSEHLSANAIKDIKHLFDSSLNVIQIKSLVQSQKETLLAEHIQGQELDDILNILLKHDLDYRLKECDVQWGVP